MTDTGFITNILDHHARQIRSTATTLENASKRIAEVTEQEGNIPLETVARALLPLGFCVVHKDALSTAIDAMTTVNTMETDITDSTTVEEFEKAMGHLRSSLTGF